MRIQGFGALLEFKKTAIMLGSVFGGFYNKCIKSKTESNSRFYSTRSINKNQFIKRSLSTIIQLNNMLGYLKKEHVMELGYQHKILNLELFNRKKFKFFELWRRLLFERNFNLNYGAGKEKSQETKVNRGHNGADYNMGSMVAYPCSKTLESAYITFATIFEIFTNKTEHETFLRNDSHGNKSKTGSQTLKCNNCQLEISVKNEAKGKRGRARPRKRKVEDEVVDLNKPARMKPGRPPKTFN
ncbi:hypothetical protein BpHYR1_043134 [Brachionus plicatilis]|uniref:Uncharacterized protein n=1 Tax=Brachionus plicatilis TaxID=10195 RepID=A0A3M7Q0J2_BRAPC|nr:hypothetical protein BpHYR1_043134 [Brachionus plicatilis]